MSRLGRDHRAYRTARARILAASDTCWICGKPGADSVDHVIPLTKGGHLTDPANLRPAHLGCNSRKGNRDISTVQTVRTSRHW